MESANNKKLTLKFEDETLVFNEYDVLKNSENEIDIIIKDTIDKIHDYSYTLIHNQKAIPLKLMITRNEIAIFIEDKIFAFRQANNNTYLNGYDIEVSPMLENKSNLMLICQAVNYLSEVHKLPYHYERLSDILLSLVSTFGIDLAHLDGEDEDDDDDDDSYDLSEDDDDDDSEDDAEERKTNKK